MSGSGRVAGISSAGSSPSWTANTRSGDSAYTASVDPVVHFSWPGSCDIGFGQLATSYGPVSSTPPTSPGTAAKPEAFGAVCALAARGAVLIQPTASISSIPPRSTVATRMALLVCDFVSERRESSARVRWRQRRAHLRARRHSRMRIPPRVHMDVLATSTSEAVLDGRTDARGYLHPRDEEEIA